MESSSVWHDMCRFFTEKRRYKYVTFSNPDPTKAIAPSDKILAGHLREKYVPDKKTVEQRQLVRYRRKIIEWRTSAKASIQDILSQEGIEIPEVEFSETYNKKLKELGDYRIDGFLCDIDHFNSQISDTDSKVYAAVRANPDAILIKTIPGFDDYSALAVASEIAGVERFIDSHKMCAYAGVVPSGKNSLVNVHRGRIKKREITTLRWILIECTHCHTIHAPDSDITKFYNHLKEKKGTSIATVATASKILRVIYWMLKDRREFVQNYSQDSTSRSI